MLSHVRPVAPEKGCHVGAGGVFWIKVMTVFTTCLPFVSEVLSRSSRGFDSVCQTLSPTSVTSFAQKAPKSIKEKNQAHNHGPSGILLKFRAISWVRMSRPGTHTTICQPGSRTSRDHGTRSRFLC